MEQERTFKIWDGDSLSGTSEQAAVANPPHGMGVTAEGTVPADLSQALAAEGDALVPCGVHADGSLCFHGIDLSMETSDAARWATCQDGLKIQLASQPGDPQLGQDGWELTPTPCPSCGAADAVLVHPEPEGPWPYFCPVCGDRGSGKPKSA